MQVITVNFTEPDYCSSIYCYNDGACLVNSTAKKGYCNCSEGWTGSSCDSTFWFFLFVFLLLTVLRVTGTTKRVLQKKISVRITNAIIILSA